MATLCFHYFFPLLCLLLFSVSSALNELPKSGFITLPVKMDPTTKQYYTSIGIGSPRHDMNLVIDLSGGLLWYDCDRHYNSSSYHPVSCDSQKCPQDSRCLNCEGPRKPGCTNHTCSLGMTNPFAEEPSFGGDLGEDLLYLPHIKVPRTFISGCSDSGIIPSPFLLGLANGTKGMLGLGRTQLSLPIQISSAYNIIPKFTLCLPSSSNKKSTGHIFIGPGPNVPAGPVGRVSFGIANSFEEYFIDVKSINIDDKDVKFDRSLLTVDVFGDGGTQISSTRPYTLLHHSIYKPFIRDFVKRATARKIKRVQSVAPFGACFDAKTIRHTNAVPAIDLVVSSSSEGVLVHFSILGHNSMVRVKKNVLCLGFVDGGENAKNAIVIGGHQLEDRILEFDRSTSILRFSSSLLLHNTSCSNFNF
ncbi:Xylanase inhibitor, C-terminal [Sesbania bispinosa]|nr:Xylanase inhibitor, C-terminal [Sesbania bispinosa]